MNSIQDNKQSISPDQAFYDDEPVGDLNEHKSWMREIESYFLVYADQLNEVLGNTSGVVAELGAGSCGLSACLSRLNSVKHVYSIDISMSRMEKMSALSCDVLGGKLEKIEPVAADFNQPLPFDDNSLDAVLFDASLHHTRSMWVTLSECNRVLRKGGILIAQRESYLNPFRATHQINNLLNTPEVAANVSENMYLKAQYYYYLKVNGFDVEFIPRSPKFIKRILSPLNGVFFTDGILWCERSS